MTVDDFLAMCEGISDEINEEVAQCVLDEALSMMPDHDDHHGGEHDSKIYDNCRVSTDPNDGYYECWMDDWLDSEGNIAMSDGYSEEECTELENSSWECERHEDDHDDHGDHDHGDHDDMGPMVCYDMENHDIEFEFDNEGDCFDAGFMWVSCSSGPPGTCDGLEGNDGGNPPLLDGIVGVGGEDVEPVFMSTNIVGSVSENQGLPIYNGNSFFLTFEGADDSLDVHEVYIPVGEDGNLWHVEIVLLEDYEVISCDLCEDLEIEANGAKFNSNEPVTVRFGKVAEPLPDCDVVVTLSEDGYAFEPAEVSINVGETVCWQWKDSTDVHNVDSVLDLEDYVSAGEFGSGEPSNTVDYRHTFTEDNATYYYVCEPHATMGMVGKVTVGEGAAEDPVEDILDESGLPSVGFVVGSLVLVGAAGLRRRIH